MPETSHLLLITPATGPVAGHATPDVRQYKAGRPAADALATRTKPANTTERQPVSHPFLAGQPCANSMAKFGRRACSFFSVTICHTTLCAIHRDPGRANNRASRTIRKFEPRPNWIYGSINPKLARMLADQECPVSSPSTRYAPFALGHPAEYAGRVFTVEQLAAETRLPAPCPAKILRATSRRGPVGIRRGAGGGVVLKRDTGKVTLPDICRALDDAATGQRCVPGAERCSDRRACPAHELGKKQRAELLDSAARTSARDTGGFQPKRRGGAGPRSGKRSAGKHPQKGGQS
jgi:DNA-binding IscR family transcriptional regulator